MLIYVVMGTCGEYSDRREWSVIAYADQKLAEQHVTLATEEAKTVAALCQEVNLETPKYFDVLKSIDVAHQRYDGYRQSSYTDTMYCIEAVELVDALPA